MQLSHRARVFAGASLTTVMIATTAMITGAGAQTAEATPTQAAGSWLADQLVDGDHMEVVFGTDAFADPGLTIDVLFALAESGVAESFAADATAWLGESANTATYIGDGGDESYPASIAKLALGAMVRGVDPTAWGEDNINLISRLQAREQASGRFVAASAFGDFTNSIGQSLAIITLARAAGVDPTPASVDLLLESQCADGGFDLALQPIPEDCVSGVDSTAIALQALLAGGASAPDIEAAIDYLRGAQQDNGGFATTATGTPNANSTGIAAQALAVVGDTSDADLAVAFLRTLQQDCTAAVADQGAIAFDASAFDAGTAARATAQALLGMGGIGLLELSADQADDQPRFDCPAPVTTTTPTTAGPTTTVVGTPVVAPTTVRPAPAATPVRATPTFTG